MKKIIDLKKEIKYVEKSNKYNKGLMLSSSSSTIVFWSTN